MSFIGNTPSQQAFAPAVDYFNGNASTVAFTLSRPVASVAQVQVTIENVPQNPSSSFTVSGSTITFTSAPPSGTSNIYVQYTSPITQVIAPGQGTVTATSMASSTGTGSAVFATSPTLTTPVINGFTGDTSVINIGSGQVYKDASGNVGIGTSINSVYDGVAQPRPLVVQSASTATGQYDSTNALVICNSDTTTNNASQLNFAAITGASTNQYTSAVISCIYGARTNTIYPSGILTFATSPATQAPVERMRIDSNGLLMLSTTSALGRFTVSNPSNATVGVFIQSTVAGDVGNDELRIGKYDNNSTSSQIFARFTINNAANGCGSITGNGANSAAFGSFSDERLKENISCLPTQLDNVLALRPVEFDYKDGSGHQIGFIAQEMQAIYPDTVGDDGTEEKILTITGWDKTTARLVKAIQEQQALIIQLQADVAALKGIK